MASVGMDWVAEALEYMLSGCAEAFFAAGWPTWFFAGWTAFVVVLGLGGSIFDAELNSDPFKDRMLTPSIDDLALVDIFCLFN